MSKAFTFSLQKVLDVREMVEDKKAQHLQLAQSETEREKNKLASIQAEKETIAHPDSDSAEEVSLQALNNRSAYLEQLSKKIEDQATQVSESEANTQEKREDFIQATKEKMVLEKLKENHQAVYRKKLNQTEIKEDSEVASRIAQGDKR